MKKWKDALNQEFIYAVTQLLLFAVLFLIGYMGGVYGCSPQY